MERLRERRHILSKALASLKKVLGDLQGRNPQDAFYEELRDSAIKRFEYSIDTFWKFLKAWMEIQAVILVASPKGVLKQAWEIGTINEEEYQILVKAIEDRNLTSHTYNEHLAQSISASIPAYYQTMNEILEKIKLP